MGSSLWIALGLVSYWITGWAYVVSLPHIGCEWEWLVDVMISVTYPFYILVRFFKFLNAKMEVRK